MGETTTNGPAPPRLTAPPGACDTHMHFYNARFPAAPSALITPPDAWIDDYAAVQRRLGLERVVIVQPTTYGLDNACQLEALKAFGDSARIVIVADTATSDAELERLDALGARGIRFHMLPGGAVPWEILDEMAARVHALGWHVQVQMNGRDLPERAELLKCLPGGLVIDHVGRFEDPVARYEKFRDRFGHVLRCDIHRYFPAIDHAVLKAEVRRRIACARTLWLADTIIDGSNRQEPVHAYYAGDDLFTPWERRRGLPTCLREAALAKAGRQPDQPVLRQHLPGRPRSLLQGGAAGQGIRALRR